MLIRSKNGPRVRFSAFTKEISENLSEIINSVLQRFGDVHACVEASGQTLDNVNQTNPVLASGKLVLKI